MTNTIREFLTNNSQNRADKELRRRQGLVRFSEYLPSGVDSVWPCTLSRFTQARPWSYWDPATFEKALELLEGSKERTLLAISTWAHSVNLGFDNIFRKAPISDHEEFISESDSADLLRMATGFHPEYLRYAQQIFANLLTPYWAVLKKGNVEGKFDLNGAIHLMQSKGCGLLIAGYDDRVRNAIAHGEVFFRGIGIQYGPSVARYEIASYEFAEKFDTLTRTSNALAAALLTFIARNETLRATLRTQLPLSIVSLITAADYEWNGLSVVGVVESNLRRTGKQLHIFLKTPIRHSTAILLEAARISMRLIDYGASDYSRFLFDVDHGTSVSSTVAIPASHLAQLLQDDAPFSHIGELFTETQLLWFSERKKVAQFKVFSLLLGSNMRLFGEDYLTHLQSAGLLRGAGRYLIRRIKNRSAGGIPMLHVLAVLRRPADASNKELLKQICLRIISSVSRRWIRPKTSILEKGRNWPKQPVYVWVALYRLDGTIRWLDMGGWPSGNLIVEAEWISNNHKPPIFVRRPQEIWKGLRFRYEMDLQAVAKAASEVADVINSMNQDHQVSPNASE